jgi:hypothetical protein
VIQPVLHIHVCADLVPPEPADAGADYAPDSTAAGAALTETS